MIGIEYWMPIMMVIPFIIIIRPMKSFSITEVMIYNPTLKSMKKKPIESDIQEAKVMAYFPTEAPVEQKCNTVGMAEGVYEFSRSLQTEQERAASVDSRQLIVFMDSCCLVERQVQENIWLFLKIQYMQPDTQYYKHAEQEPDAQNPTSSYSYLDSVITEKLAMKVLDHFYNSFRLFYGPLSAFLFKECLSELEKILQNFIYSYHEINRLEETKRLDISTYLFDSIRALPLDVNSTLKFAYFKSVMQNYDSNIAELMIFSNGLLASSTLSKEYTAFFARYFFGTGEPYKYDANVVLKKMRIIEDIALVDPCNKYGTIFNSYVFGFGGGAPNNNNPDPRSSINLVQSKMKKEPNPSESSQDLLGVESTETLSCFPEVFLKIGPDGQEQKYIMSCYFERKMLFVTLYRALNTVDQVNFQNRFYHDNIDKFTSKIRDLMTGVMAQSDPYKFIYCNYSTFTGKSSIDKWSLVVPELRYVWENLETMKEGVIATTHVGHWVYGVHRLNRLLVLLIPSEVPLHRLEDYAAKMFKDYFFKAYM